MTFRRSLTPTPVSSSVVMSDVEDYRKEPGYLMWWKNQKEKPARLLPPVMTNENLLAVRVAENLADVDEETETDCYEAGFDESTISWTPEEGSISTTTRSSISYYRDMWECSCGTLSHEDFQHCGSCGYPRQQQEQQQQQQQQNYSVQYYETVRYNPYNN
eukprot:TRINITY_DN436_c3_g1_i1.p1 TRINITY_DN436_c3_g1~~TRINITY_DN436_c3_g1_i1.p1  ORF type:complete len:160 (+),score=47.62 TRINITY_DN436_c3_g1_i1:114-593(+)